jgi:hypothetical protein
MERLLRPIPVALVTAALAFSLVAIDPPFLNSGGDGPTTTTTLPLSQAEAPSPIIEVPASG